jgi:uncharacterized OB-fold protein
MSTTPQLPAPAPEIAPETAEFWAATLAGKLLLQRCGDCEKACYYPRYVCPHCHSTTLIDFEASGRGTIYSYTITSRGILEYSNAGAYVLAMIELDEGPKMVSNIIDCDPAGLAIGQRVEVVFSETGGGGALPRFRPTVPES